VIHLFSNGRYVRSEIDQLRVHWSWQHLVPSSRQSGANHVSWFMAFRGIRWRKVQPKWRFGIQTVL
jgi:hypothetical protein